MKIKVDQRLGEIYIPSWGEYVCRSIRRGILK